MTIYGTNFTGATGATAVQFGAVNATSYTVDSATQITAVIPAGTAGTLVDITVTTPGGTSPHVVADTFQYAATTGAPSIGGLSLSSGPAAGGTTVTIYGTNFTGATAVQFGAVNAELHRRLARCDQCRHPSRYRRHLSGHHRHHAGRYVAPRRGGHVPVRVT